VLVSSLVTARSSGRSNLDDADQEENHDDDDDDADDSDAATSCVHLELLFNDEVRERPSRATQASCQSTEQIGRRSWGRVRTNQSIPNGNGASLDMIVGAVAAAAARTGRRCFIIRTTAHTQRSCRVPTTFAATSALVPTAGWACLDLRGDGLGR
jgi:hypothetical protein